MPTRKTHLQLPTKLACGWDLSGATGTKSRAKVTCYNCVRWIKRHPVRRPKFCY